MFEAHLVDKLFIARDQEKQHLPLFMLYIRHDPDAFLYLYYLCVYPNIFCSNGCQLREGHLQEIQQS